MDIKKYIKKELKKHSLESITHHLLKHGYEEGFVKKQIANVRKEQHLTGVGLTVMFIALFSSVLFLDPTIVGFVVYENTSTLNLSAWTNADAGELFSVENVYVGDNAYFYANLTNTSGEIISDADCTVTVDSEENAMTYSGGVYSYSTTFSSASNYSYTVECDAGGDYGTVSGSEGINVQEIPECGGDINATFVPVEADCGDTLNFRVNDNSEICDINLDCWDRYDNITLNLPSNLSTGNNLIKTASNSQASLSWTLSCDSLGYYSANATFQNETSKCIDSASINLSSYQTNPSLSVEFPIIANLTINQTYLFNISINNSGDDNATSVESTLTASNAASVNISNASIEIESVVNGTVYNHTITFTALSGGDLYFRIAELSYSRSNGVSVSPLLNQQSGSFHINSPPTLSSIPNITILWNTYNDSIDLDDYHDDTDSYDDDTTVNYTSTTTNNLTINLTNKILNITPDTNFTGNQNFTIYANDTYNTSSTVNVIVFVENGSGDSTCDGIDEDGDTLIDEDFTASTCCAYSSCSSLGTQVCSGGSISCSGSSQASTSSSSSGGGGGGGGSIVNSPAKEPEKPPVKEEPVPEPQVEQPSPPSESSSSPEATINKIVFINDLKQERKLEYIPSTRRTKVTEGIKNAGLFREESITLTLDIDKSIAQTTDEITSTTPFTIIERDPIIAYDLKSLDTGEKREISYSLPGRVTDLNLIKSFITKKNKTEQELKEETEELERKFNQTKEATDIKVKYEREKNTTTFVVDIALKENVTRLENVNILMDVPKCMIAIIEEEQIEGLEFTIQNADPLIIWHVGTVINEEQLRLSLKAIADDECTNKAQILAVAKNIIYLEDDINYNNAIIASIISILLFIGIVFFAGFTKVIEHEKKHIFALMKRIINLYKHGWKEDKIRAKLKKEKVPSAEIEEALSLNAKSKLHYWFVRLGVSIEESIIFILIILSFIDFFEFLPADVDYIKKVVSWALLFIIFYHVSITRILFGFKKHTKTLADHFKNLDLYLIIGFMMMLAKDLFVFARSVVEPNAYVHDFLNTIARAQPVWEPRLFYMGLITTSLIAIYIGFKKEIYSNSLSRVIGISGLPETPTHKILRSITSAFLLVGFYFIIFDKIMEWLAISIDSHIVVVLVIIAVYLFLKHHHKLKTLFNKDEIEEEAAQTFGHIDHFYDHFIDLFHYRKTVALGFMGMLILNMIVGVAVYFIPYLIARFDALYAAFGQEGYSPLFIGENNLLARSLESIPYNAITIASTFFTYFMNALAIILVLASIFYFWMYFTNNRHGSHYIFKEFADSKFMNLIPLAVLGVTLFFLNPVFKFKPFYAEGKLGVDILSQTINLEPALIFITIALAVAAVAQALLHLYRKQTVKVYIIFCLGLLTLYMGLFARSIYTYLTQNTGISAIQFYLIAIFAVIFYVGGTFLSLLYSSIIIFDVKHAKLNKHLHLDVHTIHHHHLHDDLIHGDKYDKIAEIIIKNTAQGHELFFIVNYLLEHGYEKKDIDKASKIAEKDERFEEAERNITHKTHDKRIIKELHKWIRRKLKEGNDASKIIDACIKHGYSEDDLILAFKGIHLKGKYKELTKFDFIEGKDEETKEDEDQFEEEELEELAEKYKDLPDKEIRLLLKDAKFDKKEIDRVIRFKRKLG